ncbi:hypothetical protein PI124_g3149 [Phytophthora idaei]|nr:hypothetical protein PI126_g3501 [Phytophthora idaei]KAG3252287.1 hypothetical protein PI124_g3149 [Phytophthora idaei]
MLRTVHPHPRRTCASTSTLSRAAAAVEARNGVASAGSGDALNTSAATESRRHENSHSTRDGDGDEFTVAANRSDGGSFQELLSMAKDGDGVDTFSTSAGLETLRTHPVTRSARSVRLSKRSGAASPSAGTLSDATKATSSTKKQKTGKKPAARGFKLGSRGEEEAMRYDALLDYSCRLGGSELYSFRDTVGAKRAQDDEDSDMAEASFAKVKRVRAVKAIAVLKKKLTEVQGTTNAMGFSMFEILLLLREENERKAEARCEEEDRRRREENIAREARIAAEKADAEERHRQDKIDMDERARRDKKDVRARTQELVLLIGTLSKKE